MAAVVGLGLHLVVQSKYLEETELGETKGRTKLGSFDSISDPERLDVRGSRFAATPGPVLPATSEELPRTL